MSEILMSEIKTCLINFCLLGNQNNFFRISDITFNNVSEIHTSFSILVRISDTFTTFLTFIFLIQDWAQIMLTMAIDDTGKATGSTSRGLYLTLLSGLQRLVVANAHGTSKGSLLVDNFSRQMSKQFFSTIFFLRLTTF